jgi:hypothetical protein
MERERLFHLVQWDKLSFADAKKMPPLGEGL